MPLERLLSGITSAAKKTAAALADISTSIEVWYQLRGLRSLAKAAIPITAIVAPPAIYGSAVAGRGQEEERSGSCSANRHYDSLEGRCVDGQYQGSVPNPNGGGAGSDDDGESTGGYNDPSGSGSSGGSSDEDDSSDGSESTGSSTLGKLLFSSARSGWQEIYSVNADGSDLVQITDSADYNESLRWSPDGSKILYISREEGVIGLYVMDADGSNKRRLADDMEWLDNLALYPATWWHHGGTQVVFTSEEFSSEYGNYTVINVINSDGSGRRQVAPNEGHSDSYFPSWSPDGSKIMFLYGRNDPKIHVVDAEGSHETNLTDDSYDYHSPSWSSDGTKIIFTSNRSGEWDIYTMNSRGGDMTNLTNGSGSNHFPTLSPDGRKVVFQSYRSGSQEIMLLDLSSGEETNLSNSADYESSPFWSPDGRKIAFHHSPQYEFSSNIFTMDIDGTNKLNVTNGDHGDTNSGRSWKE